MPKRKLGYYLPIFIIVLPIAGAVLYFLLEDKTPAQSILPSWPLTLVLLVIMVILILIWQWKKISKKLPGFSGFSLPAGTGDRAKRLWAKIVVFKKQLIVFFLFIFCHVVITIFFSYLSSEGYGLWREKYFWFTHFVLLAGFFIFAFSPANKTFAYVLFVVGGLSIIASWWNTDKVIKKASSKLNAQTPEKFEGGRVFRPEESWFTIETPLPATYDTYGIWACKTTEKDIYIITTSKDPIKVKQWYAKLFGTASFDPSRIKPWIDFDNAKEFQVMLLDSNGNKDPRILIYDGKRIK